MKAGTGKAEMMFQMNTDFLGHGPYFSVGYKLFACTDVNDKGVDLRDHTLQQIIPKCRQINFLSDRAGKD